MPAAPAVQNPMREVGSSSMACRCSSRRDVNSPEARERLAAFAADLFVVCDFGQILSRETLALARLGGINLHGSLLPKYRGAAPIQWAVYHGETETGVSVIHMTPRLDAGPVLVQRSTPIGPTETAAELEPRLAALGADAVAEALGNAVGRQTDRRESCRIQSLAVESPAAEKDRRPGRLAATRPRRSSISSARCSLGRRFIHSGIRATAPPMRLVLESIAPDAPRLPQPSSGVVSAAAPN